MLERSEQQGGGEWRDINLRTEEVKENKADETG